MSWHDLGHRFNFQQMSRDLRAQRFVTDLTISAAGTLARIAN
jgi:hypothetical protein